MLGITTQRIIFGEVILNGRLFSTDGTGTLIRPFFHTFQFHLKLPESFDDIIALTYSLVNCEL